MIRYHYWTRFNLMTCHNPCDSTHHITDVSESLVSRCVSCVTCHWPMSHYSAAAPAWLHDTQGPGQCRCHSPKFVTAWLLLSSLLTLTDTGPAPGLCRDLTQDTKRWLWTVNRSRDRLGRLGCEGTHRTGDSDTALSWNSDTETATRPSPARQLGNHFTASHDSNWAQLSNST